MGQLAPNWAWCVNFRRNNTQAEREGYISATAGEHNAAWKWKGAQQPCTATAKELEKGPKKKEHELRDRPGKKKHL